MYRTAKEMDAARADRANGTTDSDAALNGTVQAMLHAVTPRPTPWTWHAYMPVPDSLGWVAAADGSIVCRDVRAEEGRVICAGPGLLEACEAALELCVSGPDYANPDAPRNNFILLCRSAIAAASDFGTQLQMSVAALPVKTPTLTPITRKVAVPHGPRCPKCDEPLGSEPELRDAGLDSEYRTGRTIFSCDCGWSHIGEDRHDPDDERDAQRDAEEAAQVDRTLRATIRNGIPGADQ